MNDWITISRAGQPTITARMMTDGDSSVQAPRASRRRFARSRGVNRGVRSRRRWRTSAPAEVMVVVMPGLLSEVVLEMVPGEGQGASVGSGAP